MNYSIIAELQDQGIVYEMQGEKFAKVICPFHKDTTPSAAINVETGKLRCFACDKRSDFEGFLAATHGQPITAVKKLLEKKYGIQTDKTIPIELVEVWHKELWENKALLGELHRRKVSDDMIRKARIGANGNVVTIPIYNAGGYVVNVRKYRPGAAKNKFQNTKGHGSPIRLHPIDQLKYDRIVICGGEVKAMAAAEVLNPHGIGAISTTGGEGSWPAKLSQDFRDKIVYVVYDIDDKGQAGALKVCAHLHAFAREVRSVLLPLDIDKHPHGDVNDFLASDGDLLALLVEADKAKPYEVAANYNENDDTPPTALSLNAAIHASNTGKRISTKCVISAIADRPYTVPKSVIVQCEKDQGFCTTCGVFASEPNTQHQIHPENPGCCISSTLGRDKCRTD